MPPKTNDSISRRLTWMNVLASGAALLLACAVFAAYDLITFRTALVNNLSIQAQMIGSNSSSALLFNDPDSASNTLAALKAAPHILSAGIYTLDGKPFAAYFRAQERDTVDLPILASGQSDTQGVRDGQLIVIRSIIFQGTQTGFVYMRSDLGEMNQRLRRYALMVVAVLLVSLIAALLVSKATQQSIAKPIMDLAEIARIVSREKNYSVRAVTDGARGELTVLILAFNEMLAEIQERDAHLLRARDELEQRVTERTTQLAAANKELEAFSYSVSHDLRAPLRSIDGFSQALIEEYGEQMDETGRDYLSRARAASQRMSVLIDDLLNLSRVTRSEMRHETLDLSALARSIAEELLKTDVSRRVRFVIAASMKVEGDPRLLRVALENLISNAWKYTSRHDSATIEIGRSGNNGRSVFFVRDDGAGFDPRYADRLFGAFQRLHGVAEFPGTGVGLATVQRIIRRHGGEVWAEALVEKGATFYFTLSQT